MYHIRIALSLFCIVFIVNSLNQGFEIVTDNAIELSYLNISRIVIFFAILCTVQAFQC